MHSFVYKGLGYLGSMVVLNPVGLSLFVAVTNSVRSASSPSKRRLKNRSALVGRASVNFIVWMIEVVWEVDQEEELRV